MGKKEKKAVKEKKEVQDSKWVSWFKLMPVMAAVGLVPLIVYLQVIEVPEHYLQFWKGPYNLDFFSWYKACWVCGLAVLALFVMFVMRVEKQIGQRKNAVLIFIAAYCGLVVLSTVLSGFKSFALNGYYDRYEGMWTLLSYAVLMLAAFLLIKSRAEIEMVVKVLFGSAVILSILGLFQFFGMDFFRSGFGKSLILPAGYEELAGKLRFHFGEGTIYATLYNTNYVGSYMAMLFPLSLALFLTGQGRQKKAVLGVLSAIFFAVQIGCNSRAGMVGAAAAVAVVLLLLRGSLRQNWKRLAVLGLACCLIFAGMNAYSGGRLKEKASSLTNEAVTAADAVKNIGEENKSGMIDELILKYGRAGSGRGYIWLRSLQMMKGTLLIGRGPDTYALYFPQDDPLKKAMGYEHSLVDKPHSLYLQIAINIGGIALLCFLAAVFLHAAGSIRVLWPTGDNSGIKGLAAGLFAANIGYLGAGLFNDSVVSVAPVFWVLFGLSMAANALIKKEG